MALRLSPTLEKDLIDIQRECVTQTKNAAALALPPLYPLRYSGKSVRGQVKTLSRGWKNGAFTFTGYSSKDSLIYAEAQPGTDLMPLAASRHAEREDPHFIGYFPGFFIGLMGQTFPELPMLPPKKIRVFRVTALYIRHSLTGPEWYKGIEYEIEDEAWVKTP